MRAWVRPRACCVRVCAHSCVVCVQAGVCVAFAFAFASACVRTVCACVRTCACASARTGSPVRFGTASDHFSARSGDSAALSSARSTGALPASVRATVHLPRTPSQPLCLIICRNVPHLPHPSKAGSTFPPIPMPASPAHMPCSVSDSPAILGCDEHGEGPGHVPVHRPGIGVGRKVRAGGVEVAGGA
jgi:hypothetical protein